MGCFDQGVKKWHGMFCPGMFCPAPLWLGSNVKQGSKIALVRSYLRVPQFAGRVDFLCF